MQTQQHQGWECNALLTTLLNWCPPPVPLAGVHGWAEPAGEAQPTGGVQSSRGGSAPQAKCVVTLVCQEGEVDGHGEFVAQGMGLGCPGWVWGTQAAGRRRGQAMVEPEG